MKTLEEKKFEPSIFKIDSNYENIIIFQKQKKEKKIIIGFYDENLKLIAEQEIVYFKYEINLVYDNIIYFLNLNNDHYNDTKIQILKYFQIFHLAPYLV